MVDNETASVAGELPRYQCHKQVWALKIKEFERRFPTVEELDRLRDNKEPSEDDGIGGYITPEDTGYARFSVSTEYVQKHHPVAGGYYVVYDDGYKSYSPAKAFEEGYSRLF